MAAKLRVAGSAVAGEGAETGDIKNCVQAERCLNSASKWECMDKDLRREARRSCRSVLRDNMDASNCRQMCYARVLGKRTTTVVLEQGGQSVDRLVEELDGGVRRKWGVCVDECRFQQGKDSSAYKRCVAEGYESAVSKCAVENCLKQSLSCVKEKC